MWSEPFVIERRASSCAREVVPRCVPAADYADFVHLASATKYLWTLKLVHNVSFIVNRVFRAFNVTDLTFIVFSFDPVTTFANASSNVCQTNMCFMSARQVCYLFL